MCGKKERLEWFASSSLSPSMLQVVMDGPLSWLIKESLSFPLATIVFAFSVLFAVRLLHLRTEINLPPRPRGKWLFGNVDLILAPRRWLVYSELSKSLGRSSSYPSLIFGAEIHHRSLFNRRHLPAGCVWSKNGCPQSLGARPRAYGEKKRDVLR